MWGEFIGLWWPVLPLREGGVDDSATPAAMDLDAPPDEIEAKMWKHGNVPILFIGGDETTIAVASELEPLSADNMCRLHENDLLSTEAIEQTRAFWAASNDSTDESSSEEDDAPSCSAGVVLPTSLLDALLRSVPAASVPPLLTATLLTPFLTADYATSLLRERCILDATSENVEHSKLKQLHRHCRTVLQSGSSTLSSDTDNLQEKRKPSQTEAEKAARDVSEGGAALLQQRSQRKKLKDAKGQFIAAAAKCIQKHLRIYCRSTSDRVSISKAIVRLPTFVDSGGRTHRAQFEISTTNHTGYRQGDYRNSLETDEGWSVAIGCRWWSVRSHGAPPPDRKRPRDEGVASVWHPWGQREEYWEVNLEGDQDDCTGFEDQSFEARRQLKMIEPFLSHTELGTLFDAPLLIQLAFALSQKVCRGHDFEPLATFELNQFFGRLKELSTCDTTDSDTEDV